MDSMPEFFSFFIILLAAVLFSSLFQRVRIPWVVALIIGGIAIGPQGFEFFEPNATITFLAEVGLVFLMFMAGLETKSFSAKGIKHKIALISAISAFIPAAVGFGAALLFGYSYAASVLMGIIFMTSSVALLVPSLQARGLLGSEIGKVIIGAHIIADALALLLLSVFLQVHEGSSLLSIALFYPLLLMLLAALAWLMPKMRWMAFPDDYAEEQDLFERELRFVLLILIGLVVFFELVGLHAIIAGFFAGLVLSSMVKSRILKAKLHAVSYGFFIPVFFVVAGANMDIWALGGAAGALAFTFVVIALALCSKVGSGFLAGRLAGYASRESFFLGMTTVPSVSTALAVAFLGFERGIIDSQLLTAVAALGVIMSIVAPSAVNVLSRTMHSQKASVLTPQEL